MGTGVKSVKGYGAQFGLGGEYFIEIWLEMENYAAFDRIDVDLDTNPQNYAALGEVQDLLEFGPAHMMGDWPESSWSPPKE